MLCFVMVISSVNTLRTRQNGRHFVDDIFKCIFLNENVWTSLKISLKFVPNIWINNIPALVQIMAWRRPGDKPLSEPMMVRLPMHICVTQWVKFGILNPTCLFGDSLAPGVIVWLSLNQWSNSEDYREEIFVNTTKHNKAQTLCIPSNL